jgi:hypothetical protein
VRPDKRKRFPINGFATDEIDLWQSFRQIGICEYAIIRNDSVANPYIPTSSAALSAILRAPQLGMSETESDDRKQDSGQPKDLVFSDKCHNAASKQ